MHFMLMGSVAVYNMVMFFVTRAPPSTPPQTFEQMQVMFIAMAVVSVAVLVAMVVLRGRMMPPRQPAEQLRDDIPADEELSPSARSALGKLFVASILTWALAESVAIYGLILGFLMHERWPLYPFSAVALVAMLIYAPRRSLFEEVVRAAH